MSETNRKFLSVAEGADVAFVSVRFLYKRIGKDGGPPFQKRGRKIVFPRDEFMRWASQTIIP